MEASDSDPSPDDITVHDLAVLIVMHALISKDPYPMSERIVAQANEYADEFINQRSTY